MPSIQVNVGDHASPMLAHGYGPFPKAKQAAIFWARERARSIARSMPSADAYFRSLPRGLTLTQLLTNGSLWVNYSAVMPHYGEAILHGSELCISEASFRVGRWTVLGTLIHELAHINGAPGGASKLAEEALLHCGLGRHGERTSGVDDDATPYEPSIHG